MRDDVRDQLLDLAATLPVGGAVVLDGRALRALAGEEVETEVAVPDGLADDDLADLDTEAVGRLLGRDASTVRRLCRDGAIDGAYRLGRAWRVPRAALRAYLDGQREAHREVQARAEAERPRLRSADLGAWRRERGGRST